MPPSIYLSPPLLTQGVGMPTLQYREETQSYIPQAGTLPPVSCPPSCAPDATALQEASPDRSWLWLLLAAGGLIVLTSGRRKVQS
jgi:hypothetical protein